MRTGTTRRPALSGSFHVVVLLGVAGLPSVGCVALPEDAPLHGPMAIRNQHPAQLTVQRLLPRTSHLDSGVVESRVDLAYTSLFLSGQDVATGNSFLMDGEYLRTAVSARYGLDHGFAIGAELPFVHTTGGFLDSFITDWHDLFGFPNRGRENFPSNDFNVRAERGNTTAFEVEERSLELADIPLELSWTAIEPTPESRWGLALRAGIELPTGDDDRGIGNGETDFAVGVVGEYRGRAVGFTAHIEHTFAGTPDRASRAGLAFRDVTSFGAGVEWVLYPGFAAIVQTEYETSTLRDLGFPRAADDQWNIWTGARVMLTDRTGLEITVGEDLSTYIAPDFTVWFALHHRFGGAPVRSL